jgi:putative flippase GtrA
MTPADAAALARRWFQGRLPRFVLAGSSSAVLLFGLVYVAQRFLGLSPFHATVAGYLVLVAPTYAVQRAWTFRSGAAHLQAFPRYLATQAVAAALTAVATALFAATVVREPVWISSLFAALCGGLVSFALGALWAFRPGPATGQARAGGRWNVAATLTVTASTVLFVALVMRLPIALFADAGHDDAWFWHHGQAVAALKWFGAYSQYTLMKGPGYAFFLAANGLLGMPLSMAQALLYSGACGLLALALHRATGRLWLALALFVLMQWHPMALSWDRVIRDNVSAAQVVLVIACALQFLFAVHASKARRFWAAAAGLSLGWFWLTREDGIWILPGLGLLFLGRWLQADRSRTVVARTAVDGMVMAGAFAAVLAGLAGLNWIAYGRFETVDFKGAAYGDAVRALQQVRVGEPVPYVPVPGKVRREVYAASPAFARLEPYFEDAGRGWTQPGCAVYPESCGDYAGGWFIWALRDAVASVGAYRSPSEAAEFYRSITREVGAACRDGRLQCVGSQPGFMPGVTPAQWDSLPGRLRRAAALVAWRDVSFPQLHNTGPAERQERMWRFVGRPQVAAGRSADAQRIAGWFHSAGDTWIRLRCGRPGTTTDIARRASDDVAAHFDDPSAARSRFEFEVPGDDCALEVVSGTADGSIIDLAAIDGAPASIGLAEGELYLDSIGRAPQLSPPASEGALAVRTRIGRVYGAMLPWLALAGLLAFAGAMVVAIRRRQGTPLLAVAVAAWCLVACRLVVLALVDLSSFPAINVQYMQPAFPLLVLAAIASLAALLPIGSVRGGANGGAIPPAGSSG